jgi:hypothetical protein
LNNVRKTARINRFKRCGCLRPPNPEKPIETTEQYMVYMNLSEFTTALKKYINSNSDIKEICEALGITSKHLNEGALNADQTKSLEEAFRVANLGTCMDEALFAARRLSEQADHKEIEEEIAKKKEEMSVFHGLVQGPYQQLKGHVAMVAKTYQQYGLQSALKHECITFELDKEGAKIAFEALLKRSNEKIFLMDLVEKNRNSHVITFHLDTTGETACAFDTKWIKDIPIANCWGLLKIYHESRYVSIQLNPILSELRLRPTP